MVAWRTIKQYQMKNRKIINIVITIVLAAFALLTLFLSTTLIFDLFGMRAKEGNYVLFIVWTNFMASILYLFAVYGFIKRAKWTFGVLLAALLILIAAFIALQFHINSGGIYEEKTVGAMFFRMLVTLSFLLLAFIRINKQLKKT